MTDTGSALDALEVGRRRIRHECEIAASALASLYERLGVDDDVLALDDVLSDWHSMLLRHADFLSEGLRLSELDSASR